MIPAAQIYAVVVTSSFGNTPVKMPGDGYIVGLTLSSNLLNSNSNAQGYGVVAKSIITSQNSLQTARTDVLAVNALANGVGVSTGGATCMAIHIPMVRKVVAGEIFFLCGICSSGSDVQTYAIFHFATNEDFDFFFRRKRGHVTRFIATEPIPKISLIIPKRAVLTSKVVTLWDAREAMLSALGQLLYAGDVINKHSNLWEQVTIGVGDVLRPFPSAVNDLDAELMVQLLDGYFSQGYEYIANNLGGLGKFELRKGQKLEVKFPDFKDLLEDPLSLGVRELLERALRQNKPRQWVTAHFRSRSVLGLAERPE